MNINTSRATGTLTHQQALFAEHFMEVDLAEVQAEFDRAQPAIGVVVGMAPGPNTSSSLPMFPWPEGSAGGRLLAMSGMPAAAYLGRLRRANLCEGRFSKGEASAAVAGDLVVRYRRDDVTIRFVLCGRQVAEAFDLGDAPWFTRAVIYGVETVVIPHPSGRCREYNDPANAARAGEAVRWAARWEQQQ